MIITFFRKWWLMNQLYHCMRVSPLEKVRMIHVYRLAVKKDTFKDYFFKNNNFKIIEDRVAFDKWFEDLLQECIDDRGDLVDAADLNNEVYIALTPRGEEQYSFSYLWYLFFSNSWVKAIGTGIIMILVTGYITNNVVNKISDAVQSPPAQMIGPAKEL